MATARLPTTCLFTSAPQSAFFKCPSSLGSVNGITKIFGLKSKPDFRASAMATYKVKLIGPNGSEIDFDVPSDAYTLYSANSAGFDFLLGCMAGACATCLGKMVSGYVDQSEGSILDDNQMNEDYLLPCISYPTAYCVIHSHGEIDLFF